jgi:Fic family protein
MVYHEKRIVNGKNQNYLVHNKRKNGKWEKKSKYLGEGEISKETIAELKKEFEKEIKLSVNYEYLLKEQVIQIENLAQIYHSKIKKLSNEEFQKFEASFFTELTYNSNAIEGNSLSLEETSLVINDNITPKGKPLREIYEAKNHKKAIEFLKEYSKDINELFILKLHSIILENISEKFAGRYRENPVRVIGSDFKFPPPEKVPQLIKNLIFWYDKNKKELHPLELAVLFSSKLVSIHPFVDGNGRISRLILNYLLKKHKYPWVNIYTKQREDYLKAIRKANDEQYLPIISFVLKIMRENLQDFGFL